jgi:hypothetical protein
MLERAFLATIVLAASVTGGYSVGVGQGRLAERTATQIAALKQIERAQDQTYTWKTAYDSAIAQYDEMGKRMALATARNSVELGRMRNALASPPALPPDTPEAVSDAYTGAERDIVECAADLEALGREAADAARAARTLDASWPVTP